MAAATSTEKLLAFCLASTCAIFWLETFQFATRSATSSSIEIQLRLQKITTGNPKHISTQGTANMGRKHLAPWISIDNATTEFCVSWNEDWDADDWWTHHPGWWPNYTKENDTHYCFERLPPKKAKLFQEIYNIQFENKHNCSSTFSKTMWNSGWGADLSNVVDGIKAAHQTGKSLTIATSSFGWHYAAKKDGSKPVCSQRNMQCYFLNLTNCRSTERPSIGRQYFLAGQWQGFQQAWSYLEYVVRPQKWLRREVYEYSKPYEAQLSAPCTVLHVRRGDVVLLDPTPRRYHAIEEYLDKAHNVTKNILLLTDDANAIGEALNLFPDYNWVYLNRTRYRGTEGGWENHIPSDSPKLEVISLLSELRLARKCSTFIHSKSNLADYIFSEMKAVQTKVKKINLDVGKGNKVFNADNVKSVAISKVY
ncbi:expressed unknown protein [Seminavis robusta]|uniref:Uncharacterized protein n=1 Tax=Seminavis robusta TaxID=568900 RepID=A0A9N8EBP0_9STRA|nr:expressed unknown protein [Seminavis robusta]|eukprot:Sro889_g216600.1 n/a (423) ;mRNA; f:26530-27884